MVERVPFPPYIQREPDKNDQARYQTIYSERAGAVVTAPRQRGYILMKKLLTCCAEREWRHLRHFTCRCRHVSACPRGLVSRPPDAP
ncbi:S-adenosylmethionine:tRNA ribosyltransferase-isomerase [Coxiella endosymbiont of Ornithodoros amblus]|uniref:S-adenosylmethionine:tRNA ribosyltransferase-isomerase n=1 Tax=Coxiella endosymbiont of Ornithodoros amblus TaxID=1656166 RepID=UPI003CC6F38F